MSNLITVIIDGKECKAKEGEFVLNVARANDIFIPAVCYQTKCSPTLACRLCLVESAGKQIYACNAKVKDGMEITTTTETIQEERRAVMEVYDVNHPLQCGVCDKSGECELQDYSLYMKVDKQNYAVRDVNRPTQNWGVMSYDPGLCIVCEKCVTVCKDMIGSQALSTVKRGAEPLDKAYKENMPKDAYAMWNKLNKNIIGFDESACVDCGECIAVCPVGAMASSDFKYQSNSWELRRVPASNPYSSDCSLMYYEVKPESISNPDTQKIYRVTNDAHYTSLNGAARFGFDYSNKVESKDENEFTKAVEALKSSDTVVFNSYISNEEAYILQQIKEKLGVKLVNKDAFKYKKFLENFSSVTGKSLYGGDLNDVHNSNFVVSVGTYFKSDAPSARYAFNNAMKMNKAAGLYFHPLADTTVEGFGKKGKTIETVFHKPGTEEAVLYFILDQFAKDLPSEIASYLESLREQRVKTVVETVKEQVVEIVKDEETGEEKEVKKMVSKKVESEVQFTYTKLLDELDSDETLIETITEMLAKKDSFTLIVGEDLYTAPNADNLAKLCGLIEKYTDFNVVIIPSSTNTLGVSLLCDLDEEISGKTFGYNEVADYQISGLGDGNLDMPTLNQQEGTFTNINKRVVPTNAAIPYNGYTLNDIANYTLGTNVEYTINYTQEIFQKVAFDDLENKFTNSMEEKRGYILEPKETPWKETVTKLNNNPLEGKIIYNANPINQFNEFTAASNVLEKDKIGLYVSQKLADELGVEAGNKVHVSTNGVSIELEIVLDGQIDGSIAYVPTFEKDCETRKLFSDYRFTNAEIKKV
ncbi:MAG TPA: NADH-quinone oxidoreductase subunit G [Arcobacter sp.]|jgi:NADH-quinone oxidoreductase subunit G|nr:NADH-quinone oxidoreductase subunit G [Arcobacter sp.]